MFISWDNLTLMTVYVLETTQIVRLWNLGKFKASVIAIGTSVGQERPLKKNQIRKSNNKPLAKVVDPSNFLGFATQCLNV